MIRHEQQHGVGWKLSTQARYDAVDAPVVRLEVLDDDLLLPDNVYGPSREIGRWMAQDYGINMDAAALEAGAEQFALSGRSPRAARQYIDSLRR